MGFTVEVSLTKERHTKITVTERGGRALTKTFPHDWLNLIGGTKWRREVDKIKTKIRKGDIDVK